MRLKNLSDFQKAFSFFSSGVPVSGTSYFPSQGNSSAVGYVDRSANPADTTGDPLRAGDILGLVNKNYGGSNLSTLSAVQRSLAALTSRIEEVSSSNQLTLTSGGFVTPFTYTFTPSATLTSGGALDVFPETIANQVVTEAQNAVQGGGSFVPGDITEENNSNIAVQSIINLFNTIQDVSRDSAKDFVGDRGGYGQISYGGDLDGDSFVAASDLVLFLSNFGNDVEDDARAAFAQFGQEAYNSATESLVTDVSVNYVTSQMAFLLSGLYGVELKRDTNQNSSTYGNFSLVETEETNQSQGQT